MQRARVAVLTDSLRVPRFAAKTVEQLNRSELIEVALFLRDTRAPRRLPLAYRLYERADKRLFRAHADALAQVDLSPPVPVIDVDPDAPLDEHVQRELDAASLDAVVQVAGMPVSGKLVAGARQGVWSLRHGESIDAPFFWEMYERSPVTRSELVADHPRGRRVLYGSYSGTDSVSLTRGRNAAYWKATQFPLRAVREPRGSAEPASTARAARPAPSAFHVMRLVVRLGAGVALRRLRAPFVRDQWLIGYRRAPGAGELPLARGGRFTVFAPAVDRFYADPFLFQHDGRLHLFFEDFRYDERKAAIAHCELSQSGELSAPQTVLAEEHHLSYPFVFASSGELFMIPESGGARRVDLYRATRFPDQWTLERTLLRDVRAYDATLLERDGRLWLFACIAIEGSAPTDELFVFSADSLAGEWRPHPRNPVVSDVRRGRPAGRLFRDRDGALIRPGQDSAGRYGAALVLSRVETLTETDYAETEIRRIGPGWLPGSHATHSYTSAGGFEALDARRIALRIPGARGHVPGSLRIPGARRRPSGR